MPKKFRRKENPTTISGNWIISNYMKSCYFCTSSYQIIPALTLALTRRENADLYVFSNFNNANCFANNVNKTGVFKNVVVVDAESIFQKYYTSSHNKLYKRIKLFESYLNVNKIVRRFLLDGGYYDYMFLSSNSYITRLVQLYFVKNNLNTKMMYFEDGIGSYFSCGAENISVSDRLFRRFLFGKRAVDLIHEKFLFSPELYYKLNKTVNVPIKKIPNLFYNEQYKTLFNHVFSADINSTIPEKAILLDFPKSEILSNKQTEELLNIYKLIIDSFGLHNTVIKMHPRSKDVEIGYAKYYKNFGIPFEVMCLNDNMEEKVLVSFASTSVVSPKVLFNQEPFVILLYRLVRGGKHISEELNQYFVNIQKMYLDVNKFYVPESTDELKQILKKIIKTC